MKNQRMLDELTELMRIDVSSGQETEIAEHLVKKLEQMGFSITRDEAGATFGGVCGNVLAGREEWSGSARRADRREIVAWKGRVCWRTGRGAGFARRANRREFVDWCKVWR